MTMPFTREQFFEVFATYNAAVWPAQLVLVLLAIAMVVVIFRAPSRAGRLVSFGLASLWCWMALAYHLAFFWRVNPAAPLFAAISLAAAVAFAWFGGVRGGIRFERRSRAATAAGSFFVVFALAIYPAIGSYLGHRYPAAPTFGLPCPTTIFTFGILLLATPTLAKAVLVAPLAWALIGSSAAFVLGVWQDLALLVVAASGVYMLFRRASPANDESATRAD